ncbi:MAG: methylmalonyl-CoA epimerase [Theionarchaea archaeon]|nr:methylmalonyl-CoA epimerase [Theionarchaea archaeon]MBU7001589.1 methylmalonyl-CoA epimerase [Theionarchaea archaeon]MBU7021770.1 methylmalonyl-CoA epimerase [Theionarchaea archaeon]MBU7034489.1 methylmalonyl-CoA epimerase [Theionarchaea archaeon]MBU7040814.1 methylmalonyl-CoA epimerase [Theionarchaea archaeon]
MNIHHIGIAVKSLERAQFWNQFFNLETEDIKEIPDQKVKIAFIPIGESRLELLEPTQEGPVSSFLEKRGEGIHHLAIEVEDIESVLRAMKAAGIALIDETPRLGAEGKIAFVHPKSTGGILLELVEP